MRPFWRDNPERNEPCPCGSGKKYKKCCLAVGTYEPKEEVPAKKPLFDDEISPYTPEFMDLKTDDFDRFLKSITPKYFENYFPNLSFGLVLNALWVFARGLPKEDFQKVFEKSWKWAQKQRFFWITEAGRQHLLQCLDKYNFVLLLDTATRFFLQNPVFTSEAWMNYQTLIQNISQYDDPEIDHFSWVSRDLTKLVSLDILAELFHQLLRKLVDDGRLGLVSAAEATAICHQVSGDVYQKIGNDVNRTLVEQTSEIQKFLARKSEQLQRSRLTFSNYDDWLRDQQAKREERRLARQQYQAERRRHLIEGRKPTPKSKSVEITKSEEAKILPKRKSENQEIALRRDLGWVLSLDQVPAELLSTILKQGAIRDAANIYFDSEEAFQHWADIIKKSLPEDSTESTESRKIFIVGGLFKDIPQHLLERHDVYHIDYAPSQLPHPREVPQPDLILIRTDFCSHKLYYFAKDVAEFYKVPIIAAPGFSKILERARIMGIDWIERSNPYLWWA